MTITRETAIDLAVRRYIGEQIDGVWPPYSIRVCAAVRAVPPDMTRAICTHFRVICRQYGIEPHYNDAPSGSGMWIW